MFLPFFFSYYIKALFPVLLFYPTVYTHIQYVLRYELSMPTYLTHYCSFHFYSSFISSQEAVSSTFECSSEGGHIVL